MHKGTEAIDPGEEHITENQYDTTSQPKQQWNDKPTLPGPIFAEDAGETEFAREPIACQPQ
ncbi:MAG: hypothetical protein QM730_05330 [Anaerolineales bacterium]